MNRRRRPRSPHARRRIALCLLVVAALLGFAGGAIRAAAEPGSSRTSAASLPIAAGMIAGLVAAVVEARSALLFLQATPRPAHRRTIALAVGGVAAALVGCVLASTAFDTHAPWPLAGLAMAALVVGIGGALGGIASLAAFHGGDYVARRIERLSDEDW